MSSKVLVVGNDKETVEQRPLTETSQDVHSCLATDCMVAMHAEYDDGAIDRGLW